MSPSVSNMMGRWGATSYILGQIIGSGIFITPTGILNNVQSVGASLLIWVASGLIAILGAFCYLELGTSIRKSGGDFAYLCHMRWTALAFSFMTCSCIFMGPGSLAIEAETFTEYFVKGLKLEFCDAVTKFVVHKLITFSLLLLLFFLNCFSISGVVARFQIVSMVAKLISCGIIIVTGLFVWLTQGIPSDNFRAPFANSNFAPGKVVLALFSGLFSYGGWEILNCGIEDVKKPHRTMPFAIITGMLTVIVVYLSMNLSYFIVLSVPEIQSTNAIAMTFSAHLFQGSLQYLMPFLVCTVLIGSLNATMFACSRYLWAVAREGYFPPFISCINRRHDSPRAALFVVILLTMLFSFLGDLEKLIGYVEFTNWVVRCFTMVALVCIRYGHRSEGIHPKAIRVPLVLPVLFFFVCLSLVLVTIARTFWSAFLGLLVLALGLLIYLLFIWPPAIQRFHCYRRLSHAINDALATVAQIVFDGNIELLEHDRLELNSSASAKKKNKKRNFVSNQIVPAEND